MGLIEEVDHPNALPGHLVGVGPPYASAGGSDRPRTLPGLARRVDLAVVGHNEVRLSADPQPIAHFNPASGQGIEFLEQHRRVNDCPRADDAYFIGAEDA